MWGNTRGWIFSGVVAAVFGALLVWAIMPQGITPPTGTLTLAMQPANMPVDPSIVLAAPTKDCDAADSYRQAIEEYESHEQKYESWAEGPKILEARAARPAAVQMLVDAKDCGKMNLFSKSPSDLMVYEDRTKLQELNAVGTLCHRIALVYAAESSTADENHDDAKAKSSADDARRLAEAAFNLGRHLYEERIVFEEWSDGISMMQGAAYSLAKIEKDKAKGEALKSFMTESTEYRRGKLTRLWEIVSGIGDEDTAKYAGDIFEMARHSPERMWRVEAILKLGRYKYRASTRGDVFGARKEVAKLAADGTADPAVHAAADAANKFSVEQFRMLK